jgi:hypothetical protein
MTSVKRIHGNDPKFLLISTYFQGTVATAKAQLNLPDFFLCAYLKEAVLRNKPQTADAMKENITT